jgi:hypothetical protein
MKTLSIIVYLFSSSLMGSEITLATDEKQIRETSKYAAANAVCPLDGSKVDKKVPVIVILDVEGKPVPIGTCCSECEAKVRKNPKLSFPDLTPVGGKKLEEGK